MGDWSIIATTFDTIWKILFSSNRHSLNQYGNYWITYNSLRSDIHNIILRYG